MRHALDFMASLLWFIGWALFALILFTASTSAMLFFVAAFWCGRLSKKRVTNGVS